MKFSLLSQWGLAAFAWMVFGVVVSIVDVRSDHLLDVALFGMWVLPGALMLTAGAAWNSWIRCTDPARFRRDQTRARESD
jgi:hypothetical protein